MDTIDGKKEKGTVIFLNGVSSAGKTTLALSLQERLSKPYFIISQDIFRQMWGRTFWEDSPDNMYNQTMSLMYKTIELFSSSGKNVIVDHIILNDDFLNSYNGEGTLKDAVCQLYDCPVLFVHVTCDLEELRRREKARGDREIGHAEKLLDLLAPRNDYDLTIDTHALSSEKAVEQIRRALDAMTEPRAFHRLMRQFQCAE